MVDNGIFRIFEAQLKMKKYIFICVTIIFLMSYSACAWEITGRLNAHEPINDAAVTQFFNSNKTLDGVRVFVGIAWHSDSGIKIFENNQGIIRKETFREWVKIGGVDADVNSPNSETAFGHPIEKPTRHFYDPVNSKKYLTDTQERYQSKIDHVEWALNNKGHQWSFKRGLLLYKAAMENKTIDQLPDEIKNFQGYFTPNHANKNENMFAAAFRALGETLHCAADLCMPAHVRDDSHGGRGVGGLDPIESITSFASATTILQSCSTSTKDFLNKGKPVEEILIGCASFTNATFFSADTICNLNPELSNKTSTGKNYSSPSFNNSDLNKISSSTLLLTRTIDGVSGVILVRSTLSRNIWGDLVPKEYQVPPEAAEGQASVLLPLAAAAGGEIIDRFLPTMKLTLEISKDQNNSIVLNGSLVHEIDKDIEWKSIGAIKYCGEGEIRVNNSTVATATFVDGIMTPVTGMSFKEKDKVQLLVMAGALIHQSSVITISTTVDTPVPTWVSAKGPEFTQLYIPSKKKTADGLDGIGVGYFETPLPATIATVLVNKVVRYDWWCDDASGTGMSNYWGGSFPEKDTIPELEVIHDYWFFSQNYASSPKELRTWSHSRELKKFCAPGGTHVLHLRAYYGPNDDSLFGKPDLQHYISLDLPFEVKAASSPITVYEYKGKDNGGYIPSEIISFSSTYPDPDSQFTGPTWAPSTWKRLKFDFDGPYTYYYKYPDLKAVGFYKKGLRSGHWTARNATNSFEIDYGSEENIIGLKIYGKDGSLERRYTSSDTASQSSGISFSVRYMEVHGSFKNGHVETFVYPKEDYYLINLQKEGPYSFIGSDGTTISGQYSNGNPSGIWTYHDPSRDPADWTRSY